MKHLLLTLVFASGILNLSAQVQLQTDVLYSIPSEFTFSKEPYVCCVNDDNIINILDFNLSPITTFSTADEIYEINITTHIDNNGVRYDSKTEIYLTQTLFNDDAEWEYLKAVKKQKPNGRIVTEYYEVKHLNGETIGYINTDTDIEIVLLGDNYYTCVREAYDTDTWYYFPTSMTKEFVSLTLDANRVESQKIDVQENTSYTISGIKANPNQKGIIVERNKKLFKK